MQIVELMQQLQALQDQYGNVDVNIAVRARQDTYITREIDKAEIDQIPRIGNPIYVALIRSK